MLLAFLEANCAEIKILLLLHHFEHHGKSLPLHHLFLALVEDVVPKVNGHILEQRVQ
jgi:hypothetical protein